MSGPPQYDSTHFLSTSFFPNARRTIVNGGAFIGTYVAAPDDRHRYLEPLYKLVAQNAILNQGGRADKVECYPGTREEVIAKIEKWRDGGSLLERLVFWLSGPAGAGKSAIVQTVAERCMKDRVPMINIFFFRADGSRNHARSLIPTLLFQLFQLFKIFPPLKSHIAAIIREDPLIFGGSLANQWKTLIVDPILRFQRAAPFARPVLLLIDGLDEYDPTTDQSALLRILHDLVNLPNSPFIALVASRVESQIYMTFKSSGIFQGSIFLDSTFRPDEDIRRYLLAKFAEIKETHILGDSLGPEWPSEFNVRSIVEKSSGQFIYAATAIRFVSDPSHSPQASMQTILGIRPAGKRTPFADIDALYTHILSQVDDWETVSSVMYLDEDELFTEPRRNHIMEVLNCSIGDIEASLIPLAPVLMACGSFINYLHFYHASFNDFLKDRTRAGNFYLDKEAVAIRILQKLISSICDVGDMLSLDTKSFLLSSLWALLRGLQTPTVELTSVLQQITFAKGPSNLYLVSRHKQYGHFILGKLYLIYSDSSDFDTRAEILRSWVVWFRHIGLPRSEVPAWLWRATHIGTKISQLWPQTRPPSVNGSSPALELTGTGRLCT